MEKTVKRLLLALCIVAFVQACDATTGDLQVQSPSPYPYNARW